MELINNNKKLLNLFNISDIAVLNVYKAKHCLKTKDATYCYYLVQVLLPGHIAEIYFRTTISKDGEVLHVTEIDGHIFFNHEFYKL